MCVTRIVGRRLMYFYFPQPFYRQLMEGAATFVRMEQERDQLRTAPEQAKGECGPLRLRSAATASVTNFPPVIHRREGEHGEAGRGAGEVTG